MTRKTLDCRSAPNDVGCTLAISGEPDELVAAAAQHAVTVHGHADVPELREQLRGLLADELVGTIIKVDPEAKQIVVVPKDSDKEVKIKVDDKTEQVSKKGTRKVDLKKMETQIEKAQDKGAKGISAKITHENGTASKIEIMRKKAAASQ